MSAMSNAVPLETLVFSKCSDHVYVDYCTLEWYTSKHDDDDCDIIKQESPAIADKPVRRESLPKIAPIRRAYNVVDDNTGLSSFV